MSLRGCSSASLSLENLQIELSSVDTQILCDDTTGDGSAIVQFLRSIVFDLNGDFESMRNTELDGTTPYTVIGTVSDCPTTDYDHTQEIFCDDTLGDGSAIVMFVRHSKYSDGQVVETWDTGFDMTTDYTPVGDVSICPEPSYEVEFQTLCDNTLGDGTAIVEFIRHTRYDENGLVTATFDTEIDMVTPYVVLGDVSVCGLPDVEVAFSELIQGAGVFVSPPNLKSFSYVVANIGTAGNPPTLLTDAPVRNLLLGEAGSWDSEDASYISTQFTLTTFAGDIVILNYATS